MFRSSLPISRGRSPYQELFGLTVMEPPPSKGARAWLACDALQVHLILYPAGSFRPGNIDNDDCPFAFRIDDSEGALATLTADGFAKTRWRPTRWVSWSAATQRNIPNAQERKDCLPRKGHAKLDSWGRLSQPPNGRRRLTQPPLHPRNH
jgi:hypothetical protein